MTESAAVAMSPTDVSMAHHSMDFSDIPDVPSVNAQQRPRAMTETSHASASTATPPKLLDSDLNLNLSIGEDKDDWGDMFSKDNRNSAGGLDWQGLSNHVSSNLTYRRLVLTRIKSGTLTRETIPTAPTSAPPPPPVHIDHTRTVTPGPWSAASRNSQDRLISDSPSYEEKSFRPRLAHQRNSSSFIPYRSLTGQDSPSSSQQFASPNGSPNFDPRDSNRMSAPILDDDARLVLGYLNSGRQSPGYAPVPTSAPSPPQRKPVPPPNGQEALRERPPLTLYDNDNQDYHSMADSNSITTTPKAHKAVPNLHEATLDDDLSFQEMARSAAQYEAGDYSSTPAPPPSKGKKVMTPAEFEQYKEDKERHRISGESSRADNSDNSSVEDYDEDDEAERTAEMTKQRRKQEAKLSVYRQQMMKVTGERNLPSLHPTPPGGSPGLSKRVSATSLRDKLNTSGKSSGDEDEDDDVPLGILAAHGFPSKERAPSHLQRVSSQPNIRYTSETYPPPVPPMPGSSGQSLPVFARNLPKDPYFGASIVNPSVRESMGFNSGAASVYGGSQAPGPANVPPGGLVGIIAKEERAKALRRGTPGANSFDATNQSVGLPLPPSMMPSMAPSMGMPSPQPMLSPDQQAQMQMNQQMTQMMQMQMQWMQQMMAMQSVNPGQPMPQMPQMPQMPPMMQTMSMPQMPTLSQMQGGAQRQSNSGPGTPGGFLPVPNAGVRPSSNGSQYGNLQPQQGNFGQNNQWRGSRSSLSPSQMLGNRISQQSSQGYAASIAPSERSNIGQPSRYRPVSVAPTENTNPNRASTMGANAAKAWDSRPVSNAGLGKDIKQKAAITVRPVIPKVADDDDEDEGWEEMRRNREGKKKLWRGKKQSESETGLEGVFYPTSMD